MSFLRKKICFQTGWGPTSGGDHTVPYGFIWYHMVPYRTIWYHMVTYGTVWYHTVTYGSQILCFPWFVPEECFPKIIAHQKVFSEQLDFVACLSGKLFVWNFFISKNSRSTTLVATSTKNKAHTVLMKSVRTHVILNIRRMRWAGSKARLLTLHPREKWNPRNRAVSFKKPHSRERHDINGNNKWGSEIACGDPVGPQATRAQNGTKNSAWICMYSYGFILNRLEEPRREGTPSHIGTKNDTKNYIWIYMHSLRIWIQSGQTWVGLEGPGIIYSVWQGWCGFCCSALG